VVQRAVYAHLYKANLSVCFYRLNLWFWYPVDKWYLKGEPLIFFPLLKTFLKTSLSCCGVKKIMQMLFFVQNDRYNSLQLINWDIHCTWKMVTHDLRGAFFQRSKYSMTLLCMTGHWKIKFLKLHASIITVTVIVY
jgi:hypothetical protein